MIFSPWTIENYDRRTRAPRRRSTTGVSIYLLLDIPKNQWRASWFSTNSYYWSNPNLLPSVPNFKWQRYKSVKRMRSIIDQFLIDNGNIITDTIEQFQKLEMLQ